MSKIWTVYNELVRAKHVLSQVPQFAPNLKLDDAIDCAYHILDNNLPLLAEILEELESEEERE